MRPIRETGPGQRASSHGYAIRQLQRRPSPDGSALNMAWAYALGFSSGSPSGGEYRFKWTSLRTNTPGFVTPSTITSGSCEFVQVEEPGLYELHSRCQYDSVGTLDTTIENELVPVYDQSGVGRNRLRNGTGAADMTGTMFSDMTMQRAGEVGGLSLYDIAFFQYNPSDPASSLDDEAPLAIGLQMDTDPASSDVLSFTAELFLKRLVETPGYGSDLIT